MLNQMLAASKDNRAEQLRFFLANGGDPNAGNRVGQTCLHIAALWGSIDAGRVLIAAKADVNRTNMLRSSTPLHMAASRDQIDFVKLLLASGADPDIGDSQGQLPYVMSQDDDCRALLGAPSVALHNAVRARNLEELCSLLAEAGVDLNTLDSEGQSALNVAAATGAPPSFVTPLLKAKADVTTLDDDGATPLHHAAMRADDTLATLLLNAGALTFVRNVVSDEYRSSRQWVKLREDGTSATLDDADKTPLLAAIARLDEDAESDDDEQEEPVATAGDVENTLRFIGLLLGSGASVNAEDVQGRNALHAAMEIEDARTRHRVMELVLSAGTANTTIGNADMGLDQPPLALAAARGDSDAVELLVTHKSDVHFPGRQGLTPLHYAARGGKIAVVRALLAAGASVHVRDPSGRRPVDLARANRKTECAEVLESAAADGSGDAKADEAFAERALKLKQEGDALLNERRHREAVDRYTAGVDVCAPDRSGAVDSYHADVHKALRAGRAFAITEAFAAKAVSWTPSAADLETAVADARVVVKLDPQWAVGWQHLIVAERQLGRDEDTMHTKDAALKAVGEEGTQVEDPETIQAMMKVFAEWRAARTVLRDRCRAKRDDFLLALGD